MHYIYKITNLINSKIYIGQSKNPIKRWAAHKNEARRNNPSQVINQAMKKYGTENFTFEVIASCLDQDAANIAEEICIKQYDCLVSSGKGYNLSLGGETAPKSKEWKKKMSDIMKGQHYSPTSEFKKGHKFSPETLLKMSTSHKGQVAWNKKFTDQDKKDIRYKYFDLKMSSRVIAKEYNTGKTSILRIVNHPSTTS